MANSKKRCKHCRKYFDAASMVKVPAGAFCCREHAIEWAASNRSIGIKRLHKERKREFNDNDYSRQFDLTKKAIQKWVAQVRDAGKPCISCGTMNNVQYCGGHYRTAGGARELALESLNIHRQCNRHCNMALSGNLSGNKRSIGYTEGLNQRYGPWLVEWITSHHDLPKYTCDELREIRAFYAKLTREWNQDDSERPHQREPRPVNWIA